MTYHVAVTRHVRGLPRNARHVHCIQPNFYNTYGAARAWCVFKVHPLHYILFGCLCSDPQSRPIMTSCLILFDYVVLWLNILT